MKRLYLHIGVPKTGTTTIQRGLRLNDTRLAEHGYYLPRSGAVFGDMIYHHNIVYQASGNFSYNPHSGSLADVVNEVRRQQQPRCIITSELFTAMLREKQVAWLRQQLPADWRVTIIVYVRRQDEHLQSHWIQLAKEGKNIGTFDNTINRVLSGQRALSRYYDDMLKDWETHFGLDNVRVRVFEEAKKEPHIFTDFLRLCDITDTDGFALPESHNVSPGEKTLSLALQIRRSLERSGENKQSDLWRQQIADSRRYLLHEIVLPFGTQANWDTPKANRLTPARRKRILDYFDEANRAVSQRYFQRDDLFDDHVPSRPITHYNPDNYTTDELKALIFRLSQEVVDQQMALRQEQELRQSMPLARVSELLYAAQREWREGGAGGFVKRLGAWLRGERRNKVEG